MEIVAESGNLQNLTGQQTKTENDFGDSSQNTYKKIKNNMKSVQHFVLSDWRNYS